MSNKDFDYYSRRAADELAMAQRATQPHVVAAHYRLATAYLERADAIQPFETLRKPYPPVR